MPSTSSLTGAHLIAETLKHHGISTVFGIIGIPVIEVGQACIDIGIRFVAFRNEQSAAYVSSRSERQTEKRPDRRINEQAACAYGYLTGKPGVLLVVGGPGVVHGEPFC